MAANSETGAQLFARLGEKPSLERLDPRLIPPSFQPRPGDVIEIYGASGSGKTEVLLNLAANCILPELWNGVHLGGLGTSVVFMDTDHQFSMLRLFAILEKKVENAIKSKTDVSPEKSDVETGNGDAKSRIQTNSDTCNDRNRTEKYNPDANKISGVPKPSDEEVETFLKSCLKRLYVIRIATSDQLVVTLHSLESLFASQSDISVLMIDSVSAFHWLDRMKGGDGTLQQTSNQRLAYSVLSRLLHDYHLVAFATKAALISKQTRNEYSSNLEFDDEGTSGNSTSRSSQNITTEHYEFLSKEWSKLVTHRLILERQDNVTLDGPASTFLSLAKHKASGNMSLARFIIDHHGLVHTQ